MTQISLTSPAAVTILLERSKIFTVTPGISSYVTVAIPAESVAATVSAASDFGPYLADREVTLNLSLGTVVYEVKDSAGGGSVSASSIVTALDAATPTELAEIQSLVSGGGNVLYSQCVAGAGDQSVRFRDEVLSAAETGAVLVMPAGQINLSGLSGQIDVSGLRMVCLNGVAWLDAMAPKYVSPINLTGGDAEFFGIGFRLWQRPITSSATLGIFSMRRCQLNLNRGGVTLLDRTKYPQSYADRIVIDDCDVVDSPGWELKCAFDSAQVTRNRLLRVRRYTSWDTAGMSLYGICIGDHDDVPPEYAQAIGRSAVVSGNIVRGVTNTTVSPVWTKGILVSATEISVIGNIVRDVTETNSPNHAEGIYLKAQYGEVTGNMLVDAGSGTCSLAVKGKSYGAPLAKILHVHHNTVKSVNNDIPIGIQVFGSAVDITVEDNTIDGHKDGAVAVNGSPVRNYVRRNKAVRCGGIPFRWVCGDITDCESSGNEVAEQIVPDAAYRARATSAYPASGAYQMRGTSVQSMAGSLKAFTLVSGGSGYTVNGSADGTFAVALSGGSGGSGGSAYACVRSGVLVAVVPMAQGAGWTVAPSVTIPLVATDGSVIACSGSQASVSTTLSTGKLKSMVLSSNRVRGSMQYAASNSDANAYECIYVSVDDSTSGPLMVDGIDSVDDGAWDGAHPFYLTGLSLSGQPIQVGRATGIRMLGNATGRRQQPWRAAGGATLHRFGNYGTRFHLSPAEVDAGIVHPQARFQVIGTRARVFVNFALYTNSASVYLGTIVGGQAAGAARITKVTPRFVGPGLTAASGTPTVALGTTAGGTNLIAATGIALIGSVTSPVDGVPANEVISGGSDLDVHLTIAGGTITSSSSSVLCVDVEWTLTA